MDLSAFQPLHDGIVVQLIPELVSDVIHIPMVAENRSHVGIVVSVGPGKRREKGGRYPMDVAPGEVVRFSLNDAECGEYTLIRQGDIFGKVNAC
jgi:co-chaperonin GroES (HSP10)